MHKKKIILIRHGEAASTWDGDDRDPGLSKKVLTKLNQLMILQKVFFQKDLILFQVQKKEL